MAERKLFLGPTPVHPELDKLREQTRNIKVTDADLEEQRVSFAYGNAPADSPITKESVRKASKRLLLG